MRASLIRGRFPAAALCALLCPGLAFAQQPVPKKAELDKAPTVKAESLQVKAFALKSADPDEMRQVLTHVLSAATSKAGVRPVNHVAPAGTGPRIATDTRSRTIFVRGTDRELKLASEVVSVLEGPSATPGSDNKDFSVIRLHHAKVDEASQVLSTLGLNSAALVLKKANALVVVPSAEVSVADVREVVERLDVPEPPTRATATKQGARP
jgi:type II secretory pathway component GspD/PulD (secretin)